MPITTYYGESKLQTFLDYGEQSLDGDFRNVQRHLDGQDAYDQWHLALYMKDYFQCLAVSRQSEVKFDEIPRPDKNVIGYLMAQCVDDFKSVCELGSTLFEVIEGFQCTRRWLSGLSPTDSPQLLLEECKWLGVEISEMFRDAAELLHPDYHIVHTTSTDDVTDAISLLLDRSVSNYCYAHAHEFASVVNQSSAAYLNSYFSLGETFTSTRYAKQLTYFSLEEFLSHCESEVFHLYGRRAPRPIGDQDLAGGRPVIEGFWFVGHQDVLDRFLKELDHLPDLQGFLRTKDFTVTPAHQLLGA